MGLERKTLGRQIQAACLAASLPFLAGLAGYAMARHSRSLQEQTGQTLLRQARVLAERLAADDGNASPAARLQSWLLDPALRVTLTDADGVVVVESGRVPAGMASHAARPEIMEAMAMGEGLATRFSSTLQREMLYAAVRYETLDGLPGVIRLSIPLDVLRAEAAGFRVRIASATLLLALLVMLASLGLSRHAAVPIREAVAGAQQLRRGDASHRLPLARQEEVALLSEEINRMADALQERLRVSHDQAEESAAILSGMVEGVLAVDTEQRIVRINAAACRLLGVSARECEGRPMQECMRHAELLAYVREVLSGEMRDRRDIEINSGKDLVLELSGARLRREDGASAGAVLVMNDVTRVRRLQRVRSEFVANVSHELKTPIQSILGFAETLRDGALERREEADRFLEIIERQARRMYEIVDDLLQLSRIEEDMARGEIRREEAPLLPVLDAAVQQTVARFPGDVRTIRVDCSEAVTARVNAPLLEQALVNLLDNALKYSEADRPVHVAVVRDEQEIRVEVRDQGEGIAGQHVPRLFERFYRVDKARTREVGGTGLGLSIVKHIAQAHGGTIEAESRLGKGSTFTLRIPVG